MGKSATKPHMKETQEWTKGDKRSLSCLMSLIEKFFELGKVMFVLLAQTLTGINLHFGIWSISAIKPEP